MCLLFYGVMAMIAYFPGGALADRFSARSLLTLSLAGTGIGGIYMATYPGAWGMALPDGAGLTLIYANIIVSFFAVFALRGVYYALFEENGTPAYLTGAVTGMVSFVGYTPEIFFTPITGRILDAAPGVVGHQNYFLFLAGVAVIGIGVVAWLVRLQRSERRWPDDSVIGVRPAAK